jgi:hypothetical protein
MLEPIARSMVCSWMFSIASTLVLSQMLRGRKAPGVDSADAMHAQLGLLSNAPCFASRRTQLIFYESDPLQKVGPKRSQNWLRFENRNPLVRRRAGREDGFRTLSDAWRGRGGIRCHSGLLRNSPAQRSFAWLKGARRNVRVLLAVWRAEPLRGIDRNKVTFAVCRQTLNLAL